MDTTCVCAKRCRSHIPGLLLKTTPETQSACSYPSGAVGRLPFRVEPFPLESPRGYLCRVASAHCYDSPYWIADIAGLPHGGLEQKDRMKRLAYILRLEPYQWSQLCYTKIRNGRFARRLFLGHPIGDDHLNYRCPRVCSGCLRVDCVWWAVWDLALVSACPMHGCFLIDHCPACSRPLSWNRKSVHECRCGFDLRSSHLLSANGELLALHAALYRMFDLYHEACDSALQNCTLPAGLTELRPDVLLRLIRFLGSIHKNGSLNYKQARFSPTNLNTAAKIGLSAMSLLTDWPRPLQQMLMRMVPGDTTRLSVRKMLGNFYRHLFHAFPRADCAFLHEAIGDFVVEYWEGPMRGHYRNFSEEILNSTRWIPGDTARQLIRCDKARIMRLIRDGEIKGITLRRGRRLERWVQRASLDAWLSNRALARNRFMSRSEAKRALGLTHTTLQNVVRAGILRHTDASKMHFEHGGLYVDREDIEKVKSAFARGSMRTISQVDSNSMITLRQAVKNYLGRDAGLVSVIRAVVNGECTSLGSRKPSPGILDYVFRVEDLRRFRPVRIEMPRSGFLNYSETA